MRNDNTAEWGAQGIDIRAGHCEHRLYAKAALARLRVPTLQSLLFETAIIVRYRPQESRRGPGGSRIASSRCLP